MSFAKQMREFAEKSQRGYRQVVATSLFDLSGVIAEMTPRKEGRAAGNWFPSLGTPDLHIDEDATSFNEALAEQITDGAAGHVFFLTNSLPYIRKLEYGLYPKNPATGNSTINGFSTQAQAGMVRVSIENYQKFIDNAISKL